MAFSFSNILSSFKKRTRTLPTNVVGIDVGTSSIKVVEIERTEKALTLKTYGELQIGPYAEKEIGEAVTLETSKLTEALVDVIRESSVKAKEGVLAMPLSTSFITVVSITTSSNEDVDSKLHIEARKYIPVPLSDVTLDWSELTEYGDKTTSVHEILLVAVQNTALSNYKTLMNSLQMMSHLPEIEVFSTIRGNMKLDDDAFAIIDLGAQTAKLYIAREGALERIHRVYDGGATSTKRISDLLSLPFSKAEEMKRTFKPDGKHARDIKKAVFSTVERPVQEFKRVIEQYEARIGSPLSRVVVSGGVALFPGLLHYISDVLQRDIETSNSFGKLAYPAFMEDTLVSIDPIFATSLGAALRPFDDV